MQFVLYNMHYAFNIDIGQKLICNYYMTKLSIIKFSIIWKYTYIRKKCYLAFLWNKIKYVLGIINK